MTPEQTENPDEGALIAVDSTLGAFNTLPAEIPADKNVLAALLLAVIEDGLKETLNDKQQQAAIATTIHKETGCPELLAKYGVRLFAMAGVRAGKIGGEKAAQYLAAFFIERGIGRDIYQGFRKFLATFDRNVEAQRAFADQAAALNAGGADLMAALPAPLRAQAATMHAADQILTELSQFRQRFDDLLNPPPVFRDFSFTGYDERDRFVFETRMIPFIERPNAFAALHAFLDDDKNFSWMVMHGDGGAGKSRLALEYCLKKAGGWDCGFLQRSAVQPDWSRWRPATPHFLVIDYPAADPDKVADLIRLLASRADELEMPVRVLLLERTNDDDSLWRRQILEGVDGRKAERCEATDLLLDPIDDPWRIFEYFFEKSERPLPDKTATLARLEEIDPKRRPLFAAYLAEALARENAPRQWDRERLVEDVLKRDEARYWWADFKGSEGDKSCYKALAGVATLCGGLSEDAVKTLCTQYKDAFPAWHIVDTVERLRAILGKRGAGVPSMEPDLLGERFVLDLLAQWGEGPLARVMLDAAAHQDADRTIESVMRMRMDFPDDPAFGEGGCLAPVIAALNYYIISGRDYPPTVFLTESEKADIHLQGKDRITRNLAARAITNIIFVIVNAKYINQKQRNHVTFELYKKLIRLSEDNPSDPELRLNRAKAAVTLLMKPDFLGRKSAYALYKEVVELSADYDHEPELRLRQAEAGASLLNALAATDILAARVVYEDLKRLAVTNSDEPELRLKQAQAAFNTLFNLKDSDLPAAITLYCDLITLANAHQDQTELLLEQTKAARWLIKKRGAVDLEMTFHLYQEIKNIAAVCPANTRFQVDWALAAAVVSSVLLSVKGVANARNFLKELLAENYFVYCAARVYLKEWSVLGLDA